MKTPGYARLIAFVMAALLFLGAVVTAITMIVSH